MSLAKRNGYCQNTHVVIQRILSGVMMRFLFKGLPRTMPFFTYSETDEEFIVNALRLFRQELNSGVEWKEAAYQFKESVNCIPSTLSLHIVELGRRNRPAFSLVGEMKIIH